MDSRFSPTAVAAFELFFRPWMRRRVRVRIGPLPPVPPGRPLILAANHVSWWDPFVLREIQRRLRPRAPVYTIMLERELRRRPFFRRLGVIGIEPGSTAALRGAVRQVRSAALARPDATFLFFPQGRIWPAGRRPLGYRRGVEVFARAVAPALVAPVALHVEPLEAVAPTAFALLGQVVEIADDPASSGAWNSLALETATIDLLDRIHTHVSRFGEDAGRAWPPATVSEPAPR